MTNFAISLFSDFVNMFTCYFNIKGRGKLYVGGWNNNPININGLPRRCLELPFRKSEQIVNIASGIQGNTYTSNLFVFLPFYSSIINKTNIT